MALSESAKSRRSQFKRSNATEMNVKEMAPVKKKDEEKEFEAINNMGDDSDGSFFDEEDER